MIARVVERVRQIPGADRLVVATDAEAVVEALATTGVDTVLTRGEFASGTDRVAAVAARTEFTGYDLIVNVQGDEPFLPSAAVTGAIERVVAGDQIGTAAAPLDAAMRHDPARVKVVCDAAGRALYFSRAAIPHARDPEQVATTSWWQHLGVYAYQRDALLRLTTLPPSRLERAEALEQLRALEAGMSIGVALLDRPAPPGIDTPDDLAAAEARWPDLAEAMP